MALDFNSAGSGRRVTFGSSAELDSLPDTGMTVWAWVYRTSDGGNQFVISKGATYATGWQFQVDNTNVEGGLAMVAGFSGAASYTTGNTNATPLNTWAFIAATVDATANPDGHLYFGSLTSLVIEESSYALQHNRSGTVSDASGVLWVSNVEQYPTNPFLGRIARAGVISRVLTLAELRQIQFASIAQARVAGTVLLTDLHGTGTQSDYSGNTNNGTVESATAAPHAPLRGFGVTRGYQGNKSPAAAFTRNVIKTQSITRASRW